MTDRFALMGDPVAHSISPIIHQRFALQFGHGISYEKIQVDAQHFPSEVRDFFHKGGKGLNITLPHKEQAYQLSEGLTDFARQAEAVNTLWIQNGQIQGGNTDGIGMVRDVLRYVALQDASILILGAGGAASGIIPVILAERPAKIMVANRTLANAEKLQERFPDVQVSHFDTLQGPFDVVINATSLSLVDQVAPLPDSIWQAKPFCYDLTYRLNRDTAFVIKAKEKDCFARDGIGMLVEQAAESYFLWQGVKPKTKPIFEFLGYRP